MTERSIEMLNKLDPKAQLVFKDFLELLDKELGDDKYIVFEGKRTTAVQEAYYAQGRESLEQVNQKRKDAGLYLFTRESENAKPITWTLKSKHIDGFAMDVLPVNEKGNPTWDLTKYNDTFVKIRDCGRAVGLECGADWPDSKKDWPHYEIKSS
jgi:hypothetical protein